VVTAGAGTGGRATVQNFKRTSLLSENYLTYNKEIGKGNLNLLAGYSYQKTSTERFSAGALKLRASYGVTGNQAIAAYQSLASFGSVFTPINGTTVINVTPNQVANPDLKWESSFQTNLGLDLGLFNNRVSLSLDYYNIDTKDLIIEDTSQPQFLGFLTAASLRNVGDRCFLGLRL